MDEVPNTIGEVYCRPYFQPNNQSSYDHPEFVAEQLIKWHKTGAIRFRNDNDIFKPKITTGITVAGKILPEGTNKLRLCNDSGPWKATQFDKVPCQLDEIKDALAFLRKGDLMFKQDDKSGFHHLLLEPDSANLAVQFWMGFYFQYRASAFGYSIVPGQYQLANMTIVNFLRKIYKISMWLYLDDRLIVIRPRDEQERDELLSGKKTAKEIIIATAAQVLLGGTISREKSVFDPTDKIEFLGFEIDTTEQTVSIPMVKWMAFQAQLTEFLSDPDCQQYNFLEIIRGKCCSFLVVIPNMQLYIRNITQCLVDADEVRVLNNKRALRFIMEWTFPFPGNAHGNMKRQKRVLVVQNPKLGCHHRVTS